MCFLKRLLASIAAIAVFIHFSNISIFAEDSEDYYGTAEKGIFTSSEDSIASIPCTEGFLNGGFAEGLRYWARIGGGYPSDFVELLKEGENNYISLNLQTSDDCITTSIFCALSDKVYAGKSLVVIYDWFGDRNFDIVLTQWDDKSHQHIVSSGIGKTVYEAKNDNEWNTTATSPLNPVYYAEKGFKFSIKINLIGVLPSTAKIDNIRLALVNSNGVLYDLEGNEIKGVARKAQSAEADTAIITKTEQVKVGTDVLSNSEVDKRTVIILCSVGGFALCAMAVSIVLMVFNSKKNTVSNKKNPNNTHQRVDERGEI